MQAVVCPNCGDPLPPWATFCGKCGTRLHAPAAAGAAQPVQLPPGQGASAARGISRRRALLWGLGLAGMVVAGSGAAWFVLTLPKTAGPGGNTIYTGLPNAPALSSAGAQGATLTTYRGHQGTVWWADWSPDGLYAVSAGDDKTVQVWEAATGRRAVLYSQHQDSITSVAWSPDGRYIASASYHEIVQVWEAATGKTVFTHQDSKNTLNALAWSPDGKRIASGGETKTPDGLTRGLVQIWDALTGGHLVNYSKHATSVNDLAWSPDGKEIASTSFEDVLVWKAATAETAYDYEGFQYPEPADVYGITWSPDGKRVAAGADFPINAVHIWDATTGEHVVEYKGHSGGVGTVAWSPDGKRIASGGADKTVQLWNPLNQQTLFTYQGHIDQINTAFWSPDGKHLLSASSDSTVQIWQAGK